jgi:hypothetical protein
MNDCFHHEGTKDTKKKQKTVNRRFRRLTQIFCARMMVARMTMAASFQPMALSTLNTPTRVVSVQSGDGR